MRVFVTGATGFVGSAVVRELLEAGHEVVGLARSDAAAASLEQMGVASHRGDIADLASLRAGAERADSVIHTAFNHDFSTYRVNCEADRAVIAALAEPLVGSGRPLVVTSGIGILTQGELLTEATLPAQGPAAHPRAASEQAAEAAATRGVDARIVRLPPSVHGAGDHGFVPHLVHVARTTGVSAYVGEGRNRWPAVHRRDAARLYRQVIAQGEGGARYHAVAEEGEPFKAIAEAIGRGLGVPAVSLDAAQAADHFGWFAHFATLDVPTSSRWTREHLDWQPREPGLLDDIAGAGYFAP